jgi:hypothetical protein
VEEAKRAEIQGCQGADEEEPNETGRTQSGHGRNYDRLAISAPLWVPPAEIQIGPLPRRLISRHDSEGRGVFRLQPFLNNLTSPRQRLRVLRDAPEWQSGKPLPFLSGLTQGRRTPLATRNVMSCN